MERKARDSNCEFEDDGNFDSDELNMEQEEDDFDDEHDGEEEEESENEEEDREEVGEKENGDGQNDNKDAEMEELKKKFMNLRHQEQDLWDKALEFRFLLQKAFSSSNRLPQAFWDKAFEFRFLLQKAFSSSNRLPQEPVGSLFCDSHEGVNAAYSDQENFGLTSGTTRGYFFLLQLYLRRTSPLFNKHIVNLDNLRCHSHLRTLMVMRIATFRNKSINKWQRKTVVTMPLIRILENKLLPT